MRLGIITMHRVLNCGSALQAYALQKVLDNNGFKNEIIDYEFPPKSPLIERIVKKLRFWIYKLRSKTLFKKYKIWYFNKFFNEFVHLSEKRYNKNNIVLTNNIYDIFLTGSDQVWNPNWTKDDTSFLLSFTDDNKLICSYASSFTIDSIPDNFKHIYQKYLSRYKFILVRESSGVNIVKELTGKQAELVLDPTLLLSKSEYHKLSIKSKINIQEPYILVYILTYMFNPFPYVNNIVEKIHNKIGGKVVYIESGKHFTYQKNCICIDNIGPCEFVSLFENASFIITSSFHGTAFASIFNKPLISIVKSFNDIDGRIPTLLKLINGENSIVEYNSENINLSDINLYKSSPSLLEIQKRRSIDILINKMNSLKQ